MKFKKIAVMAVLISSLTATSVYAAPSVDELEAEKADAEYEAGALQDELTALLDKMGQLEEDLIVKGEQIQQAEQELEASKMTEREQYKDLKLRIKYMYENGTENVVETLVGSEDFSDLLNHAEYVCDVYRYDRQKLEEYAKAKQKVSDLKTKLETEQANLTAMQTEYETEESELNQALEAKRVQIADFDVRIQAAAEAAAAEAAARAAQEAAVAVSTTEEAAVKNRNTGNQSTGNQSTGNQNTGNLVSSNPVESVPETPVPNVSGNSSVAQMIVSAAQSQLGVPYVWGGSTPFGGLDCSGLVQYCHSVAGISLPRTSQAQGGCGVAVSNPLPGDIVCYGTHVGIYIGNGQMIHAPKPGQVVKVAAVYGSPWYRRCW